MPQDNGSDMHMTVVDQANHLEYDFEHATWSADHQTLNVWAGAEIPAGTQPRHRPRRRRAPPPASPPSPD